jgi:hypothetical protein
MMDAEPQALEASLITAVMMKTTKRMRFTTNLTTISYVVDRKRA